MATINFYLDRPNRKNEHPIFLVYQHKGKKFKYFTKEKIFPKAWDKINQRVKKNFSGCEEINYTLKMLLDLIKKIEWDAKYINVTPTVNYVQEKFLQNVGKENSREDFFLQNFTPFNEKLESEIFSIPSGKYLQQELEEWIKSIDYKIDKLNSKVKLSQSSQIHKKHYKTLKVKLSEIIFKLLEHPKEDDNNSKVSKRNDFNKSKLNKKETALLMLYLRENGAFLNSVSDKLLAECFSKLSGYDMKKLRQEISGKIKSDKSELSDNKEHYDNLTLLLTSILEKIKKEKSNLS